MPFHQLSGNVTLQPSLNGLTFGIEPERELSLMPRRQRSSYLTRWSVSLAMALSFLVVPLASSAAGYTSADLVKKTNDIRQQQHLSVLVVNHQLEQAAMAKAKDMFAQQYFDHFTPDGQAPWQWYADFGYNFTTAGENLAIDFVDGKDILPAWMNSTSHKKNILNPTFHDVGMAVLDGVMDGTPTTVVVQFFGSQTSPTAAPAPVTTTPTVKAASVTVPVATEPVVTAPAPEPVAVEEAPAPAPIPTVTETPTPVPVVLASAQAPQPLTTPTVIIPSGGSTPLQLSPLIFATFGCYLALVTGAAVIETLLSAPKQSRHLVSFLTAYQ